MKEELSWIGPNIHQVYLGAADPLYAQSMKAMALPIGCLQNSTLECISPKQLHPGYNDAIYLLHFYITHPPRSTGAQRLSSGAFVLTVTM